MEKNDIEIEAIKSLGEKIGYGHLMTIASALWRKTLKEKYDVGIMRGAFVPTCPDFIKDEYRNEDGMAIYDDMIESYERRRTFTDINNDDKFRDKQSDRNN